MCADGTVNNTKSIPATASNRAICREKFRKCLKNSIFNVHSLSTPFFYGLLTIFSQSSHNLLTHSHHTMPRPQKLSPEAIQTHLAQHKAWMLKDKAIPAIERTFTVANFVSALGFINAVGVLAETADHHPDMKLHGWNKVTIILSTHDQGGLTDLDFMLAAKIDGLGFEAPPSK
jgi:4a-hydroxytetrahydrobiopterin dehydratase